MVKDTFIIYAPPYSKASAGIIALHRLADELLKKGENVILEVTNDPFGRNNYSPNPQYKGAIAIYPEITTGNPLGCDRVARLIMHIPGYWGGPKTFDKDEVLWVYSDYWNIQSNLNLPTERIFEIPTLNLDEYHDFGFKRTKKYYYRGKGNQPADPRISGDDINKDNNSDLDRIDKLNHAEVMYSYDNVSVMNEIALLCGCPVVVLPDPRYKRENIILLLKPGMGYDLEEEFIAKNTLSVKVIRDIYLEEERKFKLQLNYFTNVMKGS